MTETGRRLARLVDDESFTLAYAWGLVLVAVGVPLLAECLGHLAGGRVLVGCAIGAVGLPLAGLSLWHLRRNLVRARREAWGRPHD